MMRDSLISIVVPIYNAEKTLSRCLDSILAQSYRSFELLLINDGSNDRSEEIALSYCDNDSRVNYLYKENGGVSSARNLGIENATGRFICFIDSDDTVNGSYLHLLHENIQNADISIGNVYIEGQQPHTDIKFSPGKYSLGEFKENVKNGLNYLLLNSPVNRLFRMDIVLTHNLRFDTSVKMGEDLLFNLTYFDYVETISVFDEPIYNYLLNTASATQNYKPEYYHQRKILAAKQIEFFKLNDASSPEKQVLKVNILLSLINNEIIENPDREVDKKTLTLLLSENDVCKEISKIRISPLEWVLFRRNILLIKLGLYGLYSTRLRKRKHKCRTARFDR